jgi:hypothetical protein
MGNTKFVTTFLDDLLVRLLTYRFWQSLQVNVAPGRHCVLGNGTVVAAVVAAVATVVAAVCSGAIVVATVTSGAAVVSVATVVSDVSPSCPFVESKHVAYQQ